MSSLSKSSRAFRRNTIGLVSFMTIATLVVSSLQDQKRRIKGDTMRDADYIADKLTSRDVKPEQVQNEISTMLQEYNGKDYDMVRIPRPPTEAELSLPTRPEMRSK